MTTMTADKSTEPKTAVALLRVSTDEQASSGLGIAALPFYLIEESSDLVEILKDIKGPYFEAYFVYREELRNSKRIQVLRDFLSKETKK